MAVESKLTIQGIRLPKVEFGSKNQGSSQVFADCLSQQMGSFSTAFNEEAKDLDDDVNTLKKEGFIGFFKKLQEERMKELREKILMEMGLTEDDLGKMDPEQRSAVEKMVAREIQKRLAAGTAMDQDDKDSLDHQGLFMGGLNLEITPVIAADPKKGEEDH